MHNVQGYFSYTDTLFIFGLRAWDYSVEFHSAFEQLHHHRRIGLTETIEQRK